MQRFSVAALPAGLAPFPVTRPYAGELEPGVTLFNVFRVMVLILVMWGSLQNLGTVFVFADLTMGLLGIVNLAALALLVPIALRLLSDYDSQRNQVDVPQLDPAQWTDLDIDPNAWRD